MARESRFKGSKGLLCSATYLNRNLQQLIGLPFDAQFPFHKSLRHLHCFHLTEIMLAAYSYYTIAGTFQSGADLMPGVYYEEEVIDSYTENNDLVTGGIHLLKGRDPVHYGIRFHDILRKTGFDRSGNLTIFNDIHCVFLMDDQPIFSQVLNLGYGRQKFSAIQQFMMTCIAHLKDRLCPERSVDLMNTNLLPIASVSILVQALAMNFFKNNYQYVMHVLTALQRNNDKPYCLGGIKSDAERDRFFPEFYPTDMGLNEYKALEAKPPGIRSEAGASERGCRTRIFPI